MQEKTESILKSGQKRGSTVLLCSSLQSQGGGTNPSPLPGGLQWSWRTDKGWNKTGEHMSSNETRTDRLSLSK